MKTTNDIATIKVKKNKTPGYKHYPAKEDIYRQSLKVDEIDPDDISKVKAPNEKWPGPNEKDFADDVSGNDLDIPGAELDDDMENIGSEDEENNYYSLGGDNNL